MLPFTWKQIQTVVWKVFRREQSTQSSKFFPFLRHPVLPSSLTPNPTQIPKFKPFAQLCEAVGRNFHLCMAVDHKDLSAPQRRHQGVRHKGASCALGFLALLASGKTLAHTCVAMSKYVTWRWSEDTSKQRRKIYYPYSTTANNTTSQFFIANHTQKHKHHGELSAVSSYCKPQHYTFLYQNIYNNHSNNISNL